MRRNILVKCLLISIIACSQSNKTHFIYHQKFSPDITVENDSTRLEFEDVREETRLSNFGKANWILVKNGVKAIGSRREEYRRREKISEDTHESHSSLFVTKKSRVPWLTLSMGNLSWYNYYVSTTLKFDSTASAGIAFRYQNSRQYYAFILNGDVGTVNLVLTTLNKEVSHDKEAWDILSTTQYSIELNKEYSIKIFVKDSLIICSINNQSVVEFIDTTLHNGKVAFLADNPVTFGSVTVEGEMDGEKSPDLPKCAEPKQVCNLPLPGSKVERDFYFLDVDSNGENEIVIVEKDKGRYLYRCLDFDGMELWEINNIKYPPTEEGDYAFQVFDINGDNENEIVAAIGFQIQVRDGKTGKLLYSTKTPKVNPNDDSGNYKYERLLVDAICPVKIAKNEPMGFYIKDCCANIWLYDSKLNLLWHRALKTSHFPLPVDIDGDGVDEIMANHTLLKADGSIMWNLELSLSGHVDNILYTSLNPGKDKKYFYLAGDGMGLIKVEPTSGRIMKILQREHIQTITVADFLPEKEGLELLTQTHWRNDQIRYLFDKDLNLISTWQGEFGRIYPIPWGKDGKDFALTPDGIVDPMTGIVLYNPLGRLIGILEDKPWGNILIVFERDDHLKIYSPDNIKMPQRVSLYSNVQSRYLPIVELPPTKKN
ncbi:MAG: hypothetical protein PVH88_14725 [Ignavibacteria bacterium]